jgi:F-box and WD-40 domain protein 1/11
MYSLCQDDQLWKKLVYADFNFVPPKSQSKELVLRCNQKMVKEQKEAALGLKLYRNHLTLGRRWVTGKVATTRFLHGHEDSVYCLAWVGNDRLVSGSRDKTIKLWDVNTGECIKTIKDEHNGSILCIRVDHENKMLLTGSSDATCSIWSLPDLQCITRLRGHGHSVLDVCVVGNLVVTSSRDHTLRVWDKSTGTELRQLTGHLASVNALEPINSSRVASASGDSTIKIWDIETGECLRTLTGHQLGLACVRFDGTYLYSGGLEGKIKVWDTESGECVNTLQGHSGMIRSIDCLEVNFLMDFNNKWSTDKNAILGKNS